MVNNSTEKPVVRLLSTGGTIASTEEAADGANYTLSKKANEIVNSVPHLNHFIDIEVEEVAHKPSPDLLIEDYTEIANAAKRAESDGFDGVIVTHGTSSIEENAYFNDLVLDLDIPVAFVGAMRPADAQVTDGPSNILTAARMIACDEFHLSDEPSGVYVVLNGTIHAARDVVKSDTWALETFDSGPAGPVARFTNEELQLYRSPGSYSSDLSDSNLEIAPEMTVQMITTGAGVGAPSIEQAVAGENEVDGFAIQTTGRGRSSPAITESVENAINLEIPVVSSSRCYYGPLEPQHEPDGIMAMHNLPVWKARLFLIVALTITTDIESIRRKITKTGYSKRVTAPSAL
jgi:L-asparaginase